MKYFFHRINLEFSMIQGAYWTGFGVVFAYLTAFFQFLGMSPIEIGTLMGFVSIAAMIGQPLAGIIADKTQVPDKVLIISLMIGAVLSVILFFSQTNILLISIFSILLSLVIQSLAPVIDSWTMDIKIIRPQLDYGFSRSMGSVSFALAMAVVGIVYDRIGIRTMFLLAAFFFLIAAMVITRISRRISSSHDGSQAHANKETRPKTSLKQLFTREMFLLLTISCVAFTTFRSVQVFLPILLVEMGATNRELGFGLGIMAMSEVPFMIVSSWLLTKYKDTNILLVSFFFFFLRIGVHVIAPNPTWIIIAQAFQGPSFGLFLPAFVHLINRLSPVGAKAFGQTAGSVASFGLGGILASWLGGILTEFYGVTAMLAIMSLIMLINFVGFSIFVKKVHL